jgi:hypothetical protein
MAAKRTSVISILTALILIASFLSAMLPQAISPEPVLAEIQTQEFKTVGTFTFTPTITGTVTVLVVAGGGGGGYCSILGYPAGGGGAGGVIYNTSYPVTDGIDITVIVGNYGDGGTSGSQHGKSGSASSFGTLQAVGGGGGGNGPTSGINGYNGGSGGGGGANTLNNVGTGGSGTTGQGYSGGKGKYTLGSVAGGGGGGNGSTGSDGSGTTGGNGGTGTINYNPLFNNAITVNGGYFAGGGGGGGAGGSGGTGTQGGGNGRGTSAGSAGTANTGGGGGGGGGSASNGYNGGSGYVIVMWTSNSAPTIGTVALYTTSGDPLDPPSMSPQVEYNIKVPMTDDDTLDDLVDIVVTLYYDADGTYSESEVPTAGNNQRSAILTWTNGGSPAWTIETGSNTSWTIETASCVEPTLSNTTGTFEFHFKPGKVATRTTGDAKWHIYVIATDSVSNTDTGTKTGLTMNWYGEIDVNTATVSWGEVSPGLEFADSSPSRQSDISVTYISNGAYNQQVKSSATWTDGGSNTATLNTDGTPGANEFSLKADNDNTLDGSILVTGSYATFNSITYAFDKALDFDGSDNKVTTSSTVPTNTFTFEAWVKAVNEHQIDTESTSSTDGTSGQCYVFGAAHRDTDGGAGLSVGTNGISVYEHGSGYMPPLAVYSGSLGTGWNHIAIVYNNKQPSIYLNGNLVRTGLTSPKTTVYAPYEIGLGSYGGFEGLIDEVRVWDVARTQQQIRDNMYSELPDPTSEADLTGYWKFNSDVLDSSWNDNNGTLSDPAPSYEDNTLPGTTPESGNTEASNSLWLSIGTPFTRAAYSGTINFQITQ